MSDCFWRISSIQVLWQGIGSFLFQTSATGYSAESDFVQYPYRCTTSLAQRHFRAAYWFWISSCFEYGKLESMIGSVWSWFRNPAVVIFQEPIFLLLWRSDIRIICIWIWGCCCRISACWSGSKGINGFADFRFGKTWSHLWCFLLIYQSLRWKSCLVSGFCGVQNGLLRKIILSYSIFRTIASAASQQCSGGTAKLGLLYGRPETPEETWWQFTGFLFTYSEGVFGQ